MRLGICLAIGVAFGLAFLCETIAVRAQTGASREVPAFSANDRAVIARNEALSVALTVDPAVVRRILDEMAQPKPRPESQGGKKRDTLDGGGGPPSPIDPARNPDLELYMQRASPEAAYDLMQILKRVGAVGLGPKR